MTCSDVKKLQFKLSCVQSQIPVSIYKCTIKFQHFQGEILMMKGFFTGLMVAVATLLPHFLKWWIFKMISRWLVSHQVPAYGLHVLYPAHSQLKLQPCKCVWIQQIINHQSEMLLKLTKIHSPYHTMNFQWKKRFREMALWACAVARVPGKLCQFA